MSSSTVDMVNKLVGTIGPTLVALAANGTRVRKIPNAWAAGQGRPDSAQLERLQVLKELLDLVGEAEGSDVARAWLIGASIDDGKLSPVEAIRTGRFDDARNSAQRLIHDEWS